MDAKDNNETINMMLDMEYIPSIYDEKINIEKYTKIPLSKLSILGVGFSNISEVTRTITQSINTDGLYRCVLPKGATKLAQAKDRTGALGSAFDTNNKLIGQARWIKQDNVRQVTTMPYNPTMLFMAATLMSIDKKLDSIQETQQKILSFLENKEKANLKASLDTLSDILNNYKYNWENEKYRTNKHILVQSIKHDASKSIEFHQTQIREKLKKQSLLHINKSVNNKMEKIYSQFKDYQLALYIFSFASFIEIILLGNFNVEYLNNTSNKIESLSLKYRELYTECYNIIEGYASTSMESHLLNGLAKISKTSGQLISKVPVVNKSPIDGVLMETGERLEKFESNKTNKTLKNFIDARSSQVQLFVDNINTVNKLYNEPLEFLIYKEYIYIKD
ncbi:hypothetical protein [Romboutsia ilealis]|uniref:hypothetical protein n=1 Tax=Romboutsia ilealis TaxID=1115758 RepID=UPI0028998674|nr:hypothetical protein [Romboutsia ilealis]